MQNWMSFGKVAHDLVMRMQKIDGENYPEVLNFFKSQILNLFLSLLKFCLSDMVYFLDFKSDVYC